MPGVVIGGSHPFLDPGGYKAHMIFQLAEDFYKLPDLYDNLMRHFLVIPLDTPKGFSLGSQVDFQFAYEHRAQEAAAASKDGDFRYVSLPEEIDMSDFSKQSRYAKAMMVVPGLGVPNTPASVAIHGATVAWGVTVMRNSANPRDAVEFLHFLLGSEGRAILKTKGPKPLVPALVSAGDLRRLPRLLQPLVQSSGRLTSSSVHRTRNPR
jgi:molybdate/tungstate transport system substrate-binding protein